RGGRRNSAPLCLAFRLGFVQSHGGPNEGLQRLLVYLLALVQVDGAPRVALETGVEEARGILQRRSLGKGHLHDALVSLARADDSVVVPHRDSSPLPLLDHIRVGHPDQGAEPAERLAAPVAELLDPRVDQLRRSLALLRRAFLHVFCSSLVPRLQVGVIAIAPTLVGPIAMRQCVAHYATWQHMEARTCTDR